VYFGLALFTIVISIISFGFYSPKTIWDFPMVYEPTASFVLRIGSMELLTVSTRSMYDVLVVLVVASALLPNASGTLIIAANRANASRVFCEVIDLAVYLINKTKILRNFV
jgi:hypothetical protein